MARAYRMTSARRAAIRKAQRISAQKRKGKGRKKKIAGAVAGLGVVGVTLWAANGYGNRRRMRKGFDVLHATMDERKQQLSTSKEIDVVRWSIEESADYVYHEKGKNKGKLKEVRIDYGSIGKTKSANGLKPRKRETTKQAKTKRKAEKAAKGSRSRKRVPVTGSGQPLARMGRYRPRSNARRRKEYNPAARAAAYQRNKDIIAQKRKDNIAAKQRLNALLKQPPKAKQLITITASGPSSAWPLKPGG